MRKRYKKHLLILEIIAIVLCTFFITPLLYVVMNSFKTNGEILGNFFGWLPTGVHFENYTEAWEAMNYPRAFRNTILLTLGSGVGSVYFGSMAAYKMCRTKSRYSHFMFLICISPLLITFSSVMIGMTKIAKMLHMLNSIPGLIVMYWGLLLPFTIFMYHGNIKTVPKEIEAAALIDGCGSYRAFWSVVFPMLKPITATVCIINGMKIWNDFLTPLIMIGAKSANHTLILAAERFKGTFSSNYALCIAAFCMTSLPVVLFYLFAQKHIVEGIAAGAVKG